MTRQEAATIMKKYEKNGMIGWNGTFPKEEYFTAKRIYKEKVNEDNITRREFLKWLVGQ